MADATFVKFREVINTRTALSGSGCIEWTGYTSSSGYPEFKIGKVNHSAHRVSYEYFHGPIPSGLMVRHTCDNKRCVNPAHLIVGTHQDNMDDMRERGRARPGNRKLDDSAVKAMRSARDAGLKISELAKAFGVSKSTASKVCSGAAYSHITV